MLSWSNNSAFSNIYIYRSLVFLTFKSAAPQSDTQRLDHTLPFSENPSVVPSRPRRFRMWRHLSSLSGKFAYRAGFQASSGHSNSANRPGYEAEKIPFLIYVILTISYLRAQTIETSSLPTDSSRPQFQQTRFFLVYWLYIWTVSTVLNIRASY